MCGRFSRTRQAENGSDVKRPRMVLPESECSSYSVRNGAISFLLLLPGGVYSGVPT